MPEQTPFDVLSDPWLPRFRERVTAAIAGVVIVGFVIMMGIAFTAVNSDQIFARAKDLLGIASPFVGIVIGYYFGKATSEARAENAEATAKSASAVAQQATAAQSQAEVQAQAANAQAQEVTATLNQVVEAADKVKTLVPARSAGTLGIGDGKDSDAQALLDLEVALARAKRMTES